MSRWLHHAGSRSAWLTFGIKLGNHPRVITEQYALQVENVERGRLVL